MSTHDPNGSAGGKAFKLTSPPVTTVHGMTVHTAGSAPLSAQHPLQYPAMNPFEDGLLRPGHAQALVRVIESVPQVRRRYQYFIWTQAALQQLLPHSLSICGAYQRTRKDLVYEAFHSIAVPPAVLALLCNPRSPLIQLAQAAWVARRSQPLVFDTEDSGLPVDAPERLALAAAGYRHLLVHGVSRPQRPAEIESFFMLASPGREPAGPEPMYFELLLPYMHSAYLRVQAVERELAGVPAPARERVVATVSTITSAITPREKQILRWVRDGKNNQQIGEVLDISALTVKNHVQKILRKLAATNRAQAVAKAIAMNLLAGSPGEPGEGGRES